MQCPYCSHKETKVTNKRESQQGIRRRRECLRCKKRFTTYEKQELMDFYVVKKDGRREKFSRDKLFVGVDRAFEKRPVAKERIEKMLQEIEEQLRKRGKEVKSSVIGELIMKKIEKLDKIAYVRFASVYKDFKDIGDFRNIVRNVSDSHRESKKIEENSRGFKDIMKGIKGGKE